MFLELVIREEADADVIETGVVRQVEMVILFVSDLVDFLSFVVLWERREEQGQGLWRRREGLGVREVCVWKHAGGGLSGKVAAGGGGGAWGGSGCGGG